MAFRSFPWRLDGSFHPTWSPDGARIAFNTGLDNAPRVYIARADGSGARAITRPRLFASAPASSPDGRLIAIIGAGKPLGNDEVYVSQTRWLRVFISSRARRSVSSRCPRCRECLDSCRIRMFRATAPRFLAALALTAAVWAIVIVSSSQGQTSAALIAYEHTVGRKTTEIWVMNADGSNWKKLKQGCCFKWSPDGSQIAFHGWPTR